MNNYKYTRMLAYGEREWEWRFGIKQDKKHKNKSPGALCRPVMMMPRTESASTPKAGRNTMFTKQSSWQPQ